MNSSENPRAAGRARALRRLRAMTIGTTILGVASTGAFSALAAITYDGTTAATTSQTAAVINHGLSSDTASSSTSSGTSSGTTGTTSSPGLSGSSGSAHVSTGGS